MPAKTTKTAKTTKVTKTAKTTKARKTTSRESPPVLPPVDTYAHYTNVILEDMRAQNGATIEAVTLNREVMLRDFAEVRTQIDRLERMTTGNKADYMLVSADTFKIRVDMERRFSEVGDRFTEVGSRLDRLEGVVAGNTADIAKLSVVTARLCDETTKLGAETARLSVETTKLRADMERGFAETRSGFARLEGLIKELATDVLNGLAAHGRRLDDLEERVEVLERVA